MPGDRANTHTGLRAIALIEAAKGVLSLLVACALAAVGPDALKREVQALFASVGVDPGRGGLALLDAITPQTLSIAVGVAVIYAGMRLAEAWGLWRHRAWASWLGLIGAAAYLPFELYALWQRPDWLIWCVLLLNLIVVLVLARDLRQRRAAA